MIRYESSMCKVRCMEVFNLLNYIQNSQEVLGRDHGQKRRRVAVGAQIIAQGLEGVSSLFLGATLICTKERGKHKKIQGSGCMRIHFNAIDDNSLGREIMQVCERDSQVVLPSTWFECCPLAPFPVPPPFLQHLRLFPPRENRKRKDRERGLTDG